ncbi:MAG: hypothetical protein ACLT2C_02440 [Ruminococcus sp.]
MQEAAVQEMLTSFLMPPSISRMRSRLAGAHHVGVALQIGVRFSGSRAPFRLLHQFRGKDAGGLVLTLGIVVENTGSPHKKCFQFLQRLQRKALAVPVDLVVAKVHVKQKDLVLLMDTAGELVELR